MENAPSPLNLSLVFGTRRNGCKAEVGQIDKKEPQRQIKPRNILKGNWSPWIISWVVKLFELLICYQQLFEISSPLSLNTGNSSQLHANMHFCHCIEIANHFKLTGDSKFHFTDCCFFAVSTQTRLHKELNVVVLWCVNVGQENIQEQLQNERAASCHWHESSVWSLYVRAVDPSEQNVAPSVERPAELGTLGSAQNDERHRGK